jgi:hypothetical protein
MKKLLETFLLVFSATFLEVYDRKRQRKNNYI